jgi:hypothetical protein
MSRIETNAIHCGSSGHFRWVVSDNCLDDILQVCPEIVVGKYVAVTAFDSGPIRNLTDEECAAGWELRNDIAYSPRIASTEELFHDNCYDEWYIFNSPADLGGRVPQSFNIFQTPLRQGEIQAFVNYQLSLHLPDMEAVAKIFWEQMNRVDPHVYLADCQQWLTIVSSDEILINKCHRALEALNAEDGLEHPEIPN